MLPADIEKSSFDVDIFSISVEMYPLGVEICSSGVELYPIYVAIKRNNIELLDFNAEMLPIDVELYPCDAEDNTSDAEHRSNDVETTSIDVAAQSSGAESPTPSSTPLACISTSNRSTSTSIGDDVAMRSCIATSKSFSVAACGAGVEEWAIRVEDGPLDVAKISSSAAPYRPAAGG